MKNHTKKILLAAFCTCAATSLAWAEQDNTGVGEGGVGMPAGTSSEAVGDNSARTDAQDHISRDPSSVRDSGGSSSGDATASSMSAGSGGGSSAIRDAQIALNAKGYDLSVDGVEGPQTTASLRSYQKAHSLPVTGQLDQQTMTSLRTPNGANPAPATGSVSPNY